MLCVARARTGCGYADVSHMTQRPRESCVLGIHLIIGYNWRCGRIPCRPTIANTRNEEAHTSLRLEQHRHSVAGVRNAVQAETDDVRAMRAMRM